VNNQSPEDFGLLKNQIDSLSANLDIPKNIIYYFSIPPFLYEVVAANLIQVGLNTEADGWKRIIVEKPFGYSYDSAVELDKKLRIGLMKTRFTGLIITWERKQFKHYGHPLFKWVFRTDMESQICRQG